MTITRQLLEYFANWTKLKVRIHDSDLGDKYFYDREIW
jgi:hypothetical protein